MHKRPRVSWAEPRARTLLAAKYVDVKLQYATEVWQTGGRRKECCKTTPGKHHTCRKPTLLTAFHPGVWKEAVYSPLGLPHEFEKAKSAHNHVPPAPLFRPNEGAIWSSRQVEQTGAYAGLTHKHGGPSPAVVPNTTVPFTRNRRNVASRPGSLTLTSTCAGGRKVSCPRPHDHCGSLCWHGSPCSQHRSRELISLLCFPVTLHHNSNGSTTA